MKPHHARMYFLIIGMVCAVLGLQLVFTSELTHNDFWRARGPDGNERGPNQTIPDGFETRITEPAISLSHFVLQASEPVPSGLLQPIQALFRFADESGGTGKLSVLLASINTLLWAGIAAAILGAASLIAVALQGGIGALGRRALSIAPLALSLCLLAALARYIRIGLPSPLPRALLGLLVFLLLWLWLFLPLRWAAARVRHGAAPLLPPFLVGVVSFFVLQYILLSSAHGGYLQVTPPVAVLASVLSSLLLQPFSAFARWVATLPSSGPSLVFAQLISEFGMHVFLVFVALAQTVVWLGLVFVPVGFYRRRGTALEHPRGA